MRAAVPVDIEERLLRPPAPAVFSEAELHGLPAPVRRHLRAAIAPGTPLAVSARLTMEGSIKLGRWLPFRAEQLLAPHHGFWWAARVAGVIKGFDGSTCGEGRMSWKLLGLVPLVRAEGPDVSRSAAGRYAAESVWLPTALLPRFGVRWSATSDRLLSARLGGAQDVVLHCMLGSDGHLTSVAFDRWGDPGNSGSWGLHRFGLEVTDYETFNGLTIPSAGRVGWFFGTDRWSEGEFFRYRITALQPYLDGRGSRQG